MAFIDLKKIKYLSENKILTDLVLVLTDDTGDKITMYVHKNILYASIPYFEKMLVNCIESQLNEITVKVPNAEVARNIIESIYDESKKTNLTHWYHILKNYQTMDFFGIKQDYGPIINLKVHLMDLSFI